MNSTIISLLVGIIHGNIINVDKDKSIFLYFDYEMKKKGYV